MPLKSPQYRRGVHGVRREFIDDTPDYITKLIEHGLRTLGPEFLVRKCAECSGDGWGQPRFGYCSSCMGSGMVYIESNEPAPASVLNQVCEIGYVTMEILE